MVTRIHREQPALRGVHTRTTESSNQIARYNFALGTVAELLTNFNHPFPETPYLPLTSVLSTAGAQSWDMGLHLGVASVAKTCQTSNKRTESRL